MSPDILSMVHKAMVEFVYSKQLLQQLHMLRFQKCNTISRYGAYTAVLYSSAQTRHSYMVPRAALRKRTSQNHPIRPNVTSDGPQRTTVCLLRLLDAYIQVNYSHYLHMQKKKKKTKLRPHNRL